MNEWDILNSKIGLVLNDLEPLINEFNSMAVAEFRNAVLGHAVGGGYGEGLKYDIQPHEIDEFVGWWVSESNWLYTIEAPSEFLDGYPYEETPPKDYLDELWLYIYELGKINNNYR